MKNNNCPQNAFIAVTLKCNSCCLMCDIWKKKIGQEIEPSVYQKLPSNLENIEITGGEPFLREDLAEIIKVLKNTCPRARILITTNGLLPEIIDRVAPCQMAFRVSLDGGGEIHDKIRGVSGAYQKVRRTIKILKRLKVKDLGIIFTLMKLNKNELKKVLDFCKKEKLNFSLNLVHDSPIYFGKAKMALRPKQRVTKKNLRQVIKFFAPSLNPKNWAKAWFYQKLIDYAKTGKRPIKCGAGEEFFYLDPSGNVYLCQFKNWKIGNLVRQSFSQIWQGKKRKKYLKLAKNCHDCFMICTVKDQIKKEKLKVFWQMIS